MLQAKAPRATIQDVAALSGLSICTVSRALRNLPNVSASAQAKVSDAAAKLGYKASTAASRLAGGTTGSVAIIAPTATAWFFAQAVEAAEEVFAGAGYDTVLISLRNRPSVHNKLFSDLAGLSQRVDGILLLNIALSEAELAAVEASGLAVASVGMHDVPWDNVGIDNAGAARAATEHLLDLGHWDVAMLSGRETGEPSLITANERLRGFEQALEAHHVTVDPDLVLEAGSSIEGGRLAMIELIENRRMPSAILAGCDETAFGALMALRDHGLSAPKNMSIIGIDDHQMSWFLGLSTISQPVADQGAFAANLLIDRLHRSGLPNPPSSHMLETKLIERKSTRRRR
ncbi:LacI family transcriptional regulator [Arthrobacter sp. NicSoilB4]|uniref:LacI family DNA-binding transcriptional regulator n=1 Tax=Arthrobacter sp. NicSoilB4 TaxID=2830997 RepID=UPI001CC7E9B0|nr:LacI family DNA-binding transcriptional regulator [Arthrobacter sp. NicSoilB4]BCW65488.1 LacI family transcriptional regulator [Arthrobacter sp. NicSoilB4]